MVAGFKHSVALIFSLLFTQVAFAGSKTVPFIQTHFPDWLAQRPSPLKTQRYKAWDASYYRYAYKKIESFPILLGANGHNPMGRLCSNFLSFSLEQKKSIWSRTMMVHAWSESYFNNRDRGDESCRLDRAEGMYQLCRRMCRGVSLSQPLPSMAKTMDLLARKVSRGNFLIYDNYPREYPEIINRQSTGRSHWSVLRTEGTDCEGKIINPMRSKFLPAFERYVPECHQRLSKRGFAPVAEFYKLPAQLPGFAPL